MSRFLHVANGTSVTDTLAQTTIPGQRSIWADPLYDGPVPATSDEELVEIRTRFLLGSGVPDEEHDLFDQLNLIRLFT